MNVIIKLHAELRKAFGRKEVLISINRDAATIADALDALLANEAGGKHAARIIAVNQAPGVNIATGASLNPSVIVLINDVDYRLAGGLVAPLHDGDSITLLPTIHGG